MLLKFRNCICDEGNKYLLFFIEFEEIDFFFFFFFFFDCPSEKPRNNTPKIQRNNNFEQKKKRERKRQKKENRPIFEEFYLILYIDKKIKTP